MPAEFHWWRSNKKLSLVLHERSWNTNQSGGIEGSIDYLNGVLHLLQQYASHITATAHIIHIFLGFTSTRLGLWRVLPKDTPTKKKPEDPVRPEPGTLD